jgi:alginate O-acetyltransferase complex protein AlgI
MVFSSISFLFLFLPVVLTGYFLVGKKGRNVFLVAANLAFYAWGEGKYVAALIVCIIANYSFGVLIDKYGKKRSSAAMNLSKLYLAMAIVFNIGFLVHFKYTNFLVHNLNKLFSLIGLGAIDTGSIHLPVGISFFTFQALSYVIDVYRKDVPATYNLINFALYKSLFPQVIAGPIVRYRDVAGEVVKRIITPERFALGVRRFITGLGKKVLIANTVAAVADQVFAIPAHTLRPGVAWLGILCYTLQIFFDFSGYSDMAIGLGQMLGFKFLENFNYPYISRSIQEFWRRWHMSLSSWFRDYLYIPLGGNRREPWRTYINLFLVFILCGLWHGASWTFVVWGLWHGVFIILERVRLGSFLGSLRPPIGHVYAILVVMIGWVFFRAPDLLHALLYIKALFGYGGKGMDRVAFFMSPELLLAIAAGVVCSVPASELFKRIGSTLVSSGKCPEQLATIGFAIKLIFLFSVLFASFMALASGTYNPFIYFRF